MLMRISMRIVAEGRCETETCRSCKAILPIRDARLLMSRIRVTVHHRTDAHNDDLDDEVR